MYKKFLLKKTNPYKILGYKVLNDGTELFGNDKSIAPQAWLHQIFPSLKKIEIIKLEKILQVTLPTSLVDFYQEMNGFRIFVGELSVNGLRKNFSRDIESAWQPFSIETKNRQERPINATEKDIFIGFYSKNGNLVYIDAKNEEVFLCTVDNANPIKRWENLYNFFVEELENIFDVYDSKYLSRA